MVLNLDLAPSIADLAGIPDPSGLEGRSLVPLLDGTSGPWREEFLIDSAGGIITRPCTAMRTQRYKYIRTEAETGVTEEIYDLENDPHELENRWDDPTSKAQRAEVGERLTELMIAAANPSYRPNFIA